MQRDDESRQMAAELSVADLDRDGFADVIASVRTPAAAPLVPTTEQAYDHAVMVLWGGRRALSAERSYTLKVELPQPDSSRPGAGEGLLLDAGDVVGDGRRELVVAWPGRADTNPPVAGEMFVYTVDDSRAVAMVSRHEAEGGLSDLVVADVAGGRRDDVVVGEPSGAVNTSQNGDSTGRLLVWRGTRTALVGPAVVAQSSRGVPGGDQNGDAFGTALAAADIDRDGKDDLAIGAPGEDAGTGRVTILHGNRGALGRGGGSIFSQDTKGVKDRGEGDDAFGAEVSLLDVDGNGTSDLVVGAPGEDGDDGAVTVILGGNRSLRPVVASQTIRGGDVGLGEPRDGETTWAAFGRVIGR